MKTNQTLREQLIPSAKYYTLDKLLADCRKYIDITGRRVTFEYILLGGVNDLPEQAMQLPKCLKGFQSHVNLIPYNPIEEADYERPTAESINVFKSILEGQNIAVSIRYSRGLEANAACGQLRTMLRVR